MKNKQPMSKAKKEFIASIIWIVAGVLFIAGGSVMVSMNKTPMIIGGSIMLACGVAIVIISIIALAKKKKQSK